jgi:hypothetical protein
MKTAFLTPMENHACHLITGGREFMPEMDIFFRIKLSVGLTADFQKED